MADEHAGFSLSARVNYAGLTKANEQTLKWYENARKVESLMSGMRVSNALPRDIQKLDDVTASYVRRLESEGKAYKANKVVVNAYQTEIDKLTRRQKGLESQLEHVAQKFGKNSQQFKEQQIRINENATALNHLKSNYSTASRSVGEYATQMSKLQRELHANTAVQSSEINKLSSAGKAYEAAKVKSEAYKSSIDNLTKQQALQVKELERIAIETGKSSEAYKAQKIAVNETATQINHLKTSLSGVNSEMRQIKPTFLDRMHAKLIETNKDAEKTHSLFKSMFSANLLSNAVSSGFGAIKTGIRGMIDAAHEYNIEQETMNATWLTLTGSASKGKAMVEQIDGMAAAAQNDTKMVDQLSQKFYAINKSPEQTAKITKSVLTLQDAFGRTDDAVENFGVQFSQMMANQKVSAQDMMSFVNVFPEYRQQLLKTVNSQNHTKLSMKQMNDMMSKGKISSKTAIDALEEMAQRYKSATDNFTKTIPGMIRTVKSQMRRLTAAFDAPFTKLENPIIKQVSDWATSGKTQKAFERLGSTVSKGLNNVLSKMTGIKPKAPKANTPYSTDLKKAMTYSNGLNKTMSSLSKSQQDEVKEQMKNFSYKDLKKTMTVKDLTTPKLGKNLAPWQNPLQGGSKTQTGTASKAYTTDLAKQLVFLRGLQSEEKKHNSQLEKQKTLGDILNNTIDRFGKGIGKAMDYIADHAKDIKDIVKDVVTITTTIGKSVWNGFTNILTTIGKATHLIGKDAEKNGGAIHAIAQMLNNIAKNKTLLDAVGKTIVGIFAFKGLKTAVGGLKALSRPLIDTGTGIRGVIRGLKGFDDAKAIGKMSAVEKRLFSIGKGTRTVAGKIKDGAGVVKGAFQKIPTAFGKIKDSKFVGSVVETAGKFKDKTKLFAKYAKDGAVDAGKAFASKFKQQASLVGKGFKSVGSALVKGAKGIASEAKSAGRFLAQQVSAGFKKSVDFGKGLYGKGSGAGKLTGALQSMRSVNKAGGTKGLVSGFKGLSTAGKVATGLAGAGVAVDAGAEFVNAFKDRHNASKRSTDIGKGIGAGIGGGIGMWFGGPAGAAIGATIGKKVGAWGGQAVNKFTKGWQSKKPPKNFWSLENLGWSAHSMWKGFTGSVGKTIKWFKKNWKEIGLYFVNPIAGAINSLYKHNKGFHKWVDGLARGFKRAWNGIGRWFGNLGKGIQKSWHGMTSWFGKIGHGMLSGVKDAWHGITGWFGGIIGGIKKIWNGTTSWFGNLGKGMVKGIKNAWNGVTGFFGDIWDKIKGIVEPIVKAAGFAGKLVTGQVKVGKLHLATGTGRLEEDTHAIVNDGNDSPATGNRESIFYPNGKIEIPKGRNVEKILPKHTKVLNAKDTARVFGKSHLIGKTVKHLAQGTTKLVSTKGKNVTATHSLNVKSSVINNRELLNVRNSTRKVTENYQQLTSKSEKSLTKFARSSSTTWRKVTAQTNKQTNKLHRNTVSEFTSLTRKTNKQTDKARENTISDFTHMRKGVDKQMDVMHDAVVDTARATARSFGKALDKMQDYARDAMKATIAELNKGITGVDRVLAEFGGNGTAIKPVHFATGSNGELQNNTLAVVNDATSGPRQEAIVRGNNLILPHGKDRLIPLQKGDQVLNGTQTQKMAEAFGLPHFAKGSGVKDGGLKNLYNIAKNNWKHPEETGKRILPQTVPNVKGGAGKIANAANKVGVQQGLEYWSTLWGMVQNKIEDSDDSGPASGLLKAAEKYGEGKSYVWGAANGSSFDCSGLVMYTLKRAYGIDFPHFSGSQYALTEHISKSSARMGDLVFWGSGGSDHVGIYAGGNKYFSAQSPSQGIHMNTLDSVVGKGTPLFGRVKGVNTEGSKSTAPKIKAKNGIQKFVKASVGSGFWRTIQKIADEFGNGSMANPAGDSVMRWKPVIKRAAEKMHVRLSDDDMNHILTVTTHESGGNPNSINTWDSNAKAGTPSKGVIQFIQPTFDKYAVKGHHNINSGYDQYLAMFNDSTWRSDLKLGGWGPTGAPRGYSKGGNAPARTPFIAGENGPELITANGPVHIDSHEQTKRKLSDIKNLMSPKTMKDITSKFTINKPRNSVTNTKPVININITGPISSKSDATKYADMIADKIASVFERIGDDYGLDLSIF